MLDVACGTGAVSTQVMQIIGSSGMLVGIDFARGALEIARSSVPTGHFVEMDAENIGLYLKFDQDSVSVCIDVFPRPGARSPSPLFTLEKSR